MFDEFGYSYWLETHVCNCMCMRMSDVPKPSRLLQTSHMKGYTEACSLEGALE